MTQFEFETEMMKNNSAKKAEIAPLKQKIADLTLERKRLRADKERIMSQMIELSENINDIEHKISAIKQKYQEKRDVLHAEFVRDREAIV